MRDIEGIERVVENLKPHWRDIRAHFDAENSRFKALMSRNHDLLGRVLKCHLIVENYLERFLATHYGIDDIESVKLSYFQKAKLLPDTGSAAAFVKLGVLELNTIRNRFGHTLEANIAPEQLRAINQVLDVAREGINFETSIERIEAFTTVACTFMVIVPPNLQDIFMSAFSEIRVNAL